MKINRVEIFDCEVNRKDPTMAAFNPVLIRVGTDEGLSGIGEVGLAYGNASKAAVGIIRDLGKLIIGRDPMKIEALWEYLFRGTFWGMGGGPVIYGGISAIDIACWDIRGKALNAPIYQLLGGKTKEELRTYASQLQFDWDPQYKRLTEPPQYAEAARKALAEGYDSIKVDPIMIDRHGKRPNESDESWNFYGILKADQLRMAVDRVRAMREATGPDVDIIIEIHSYLGANSAKQLGRALEEFNIFYYEEPIYPLNVENMGEVADKVKIPIASGERIYTRWGYRPFLEKGALAVIQPDLCLVGGITEGKKICDFANVYDATVQVHVCGGPVSTAAALQIEATIPNFIIHEHHTYALKSAIRELCKYDYQPENGMFRAPDLPGLGQELNDAVVKDYLAYTLE
ncbi:MAG: mandelate racemase/muconate lactonizing enzyme family protein [Synergistaceae bacterium]|nr:mandelate racemase/muconate lactonizing enzyme family protein [Synergistaceae bacterium]